MRSWLTLTLLLCTCGPGDSGDETASAATPAGSDPTGVTTVPDGTTAGGTTTATPTTGGSTTDSAPTTTGTSAVDPDSSSAPADTTEGSTGAVKLDIEVPEPDPIPVHDIPGLMSITFYETTGMITEYTFLIDGPELNGLLADPLSMANRDIQGTSVEFYDVYYSDIDGVFDPDGSYLTIAGSFGAKLPAGGGLNLAEISLNSAIIA